MIDKQERGCRVYWQIQDKTDPSQIDAEGWMRSKGNNSGDILGEAASSLYCIWPDDIWMVNFLGIVWDDEVTAHPNTLAAVTFPE